MAVSFILLKSKFIVTYIILTLELQLSRDLIKRLNNVEVQNNLEAMKSFLEKIKNTRKDASRQWQ